MNLASFTLMRNERPILGPFMDQLHEFFDHSILLDHESTDGTLAYATEHAGPGIALYRLKSTGYPQSEVATRFLNRIMATTNADWVFFLDCDEFLPCRRMHGPTSYTCTGVMLHRNLWMGATYLRGSLLR
jgi:hypothetical protein